MADLWTTIKNTIGIVAPVLGNAILPGVGGVAGSLVAKLLGCSNTPEAIATATASMTPDQIVALQKGENDHMEELLKIASAQDQNYLLDIQNARQREVDVVKATGKKDINLYVLAWVIMGGFMGLIAGLIACQLMGHPISADPMLTLLLGSLSTDAGMVVGYFFGSSKSSSDKTNLLFNSVPISSLPKQ